MEKSKKGLLIKGKSASFVSQPKGSDCCSAFLPLNIHCLSSQCVQSIVHGVMSDDVARLLNRARHYSAVRSHGLYQPRI